MTLTPVWCKNPFCSFLMARGKPRLVGKVSECAELACPACRQIAMYDVRVAVTVAAR